MQSYPCGFSWGSRRRVGALSFRWDFGGRGRSKLWGQCYSPVDSSMCAAPTTTGVGRIVPPHDFISEYVHENRIKIRTLGTSQHVHYKKKNPLCYTRSKQWPGEFLLSSAPPALQVS